MPHDLEHIPETAPAAPEPAVTPEMVRVGVDVLDSYFAEHEMLDLERPDAVTAVYRAMCKAATLETTRQQSS